VDGLLEGIILTHQFTIILQLYYLLPRVWGKEGKSCHNPENHIT